MQTGRTLLITLSISSNKSDIERLVVMGRTMFEVRCSIVGNQK